MTTTTTSRDDERSRRQHAADILLAYGAGRGFPPGWQADAARAIGISEAQVSRTIRMRQSLGDRMIERMRAALCSGTVPAIQSSQRIRSEEVAVREKPAKTPNRDGLEKLRESRTRATQEFRALVMSYGERRNFARGWQADAAEIVGMSSGDLSRVVDGAKRVSEITLARARERFASPVVAEVENRRNERKSAAMERRAMAREIIEGFGRRHSFARGWKSRAAESVGLHHSVILAMLRGSLAVSESSLATLRSALERDDA